jgi:hypothetical protein
MDFARKKSILEGLNTKSLLADLDKAQTELDTAMHEEAHFKSDRSEYLASRSDDCSAVKNLVAELAPGAVGKNAEERSAWLTRQRHENKGLQDAILRQRETAFLLDDHRIRVETAKRRYDALMGVIALRTAQIRFFASEGN